MYKAVVIQSEPKGETYQKLLKFAGEYCENFSLNWIRGKSGDHVKAKTLEKELQPFIVQEECIDPWFDNTFKVTYALNADTLNILNQVDSLYLWQKHGWPVNLAFYANDNNIWLYSQSEDYYAHIYSSAFPHQFVQQQIPELDLALKKPKIFIDGKKFRSLEEFYDEVSINLISGASWGRNLAAFDDILMGGFGTPENGFVLVWKNSEISKRELGYPETIKFLERNLETCHPTGRVSVAEKLRKARQQDGATVFDWIVEIINKHEIIDLMLE